MGQVYLAYDERLDRHVAIKHVVTAADASQRLRFRREARAVARLSHPHIVQVFDVLETDEGEWIVMERVDGPPLAQRVIDGDLDLVTAVSLGRQVAEGLAEAHDKGILHRDLKSENVLVDAGGRAKILDFGLAKPLWGGDTEATLSIEGKVLGTCRSMSPEQARGLELDARSDLFSLGTLLYEMVTGKSPFQGPTAMDTLGRVCNLVQTPARSLRPQVPEALSNLIDRLLAKLPRNRPASAREVAAELAAIAASLDPVSGSTSAMIPRGGSVTEATVSETPLSVQLSDRTTRPTARWNGETWGARQLRPGWPTLVAVAAAVLVLGGASWWWRGEWARSIPRRTPTEGVVGTATPFPVRPSVAVLGFKNLSGEAESAWLSTGFAEMLAAELAAGQRLRTITGENIARARRELSLAEGESLAPDTLSRVRSILGADLVVQGSYLVAPEPGRKLRLVLNIQDTAAGDTVLTLSETGSQAEVLDLISRVGRQLRRHLGLGEVSPAAAEQARASVPTRSEALRLYSEGLERLRAYDYITARDLLARAIEVEPDHPLAHAALAEAWSALGYDERARREAHRAVEVAEKLSREDRLFVEARDHEMSHRWGEAIKTYQALWEFFPDNLDYGLRLTGALTSAGRGHEALETVAALRRLPGPAAEDVRIDLAEAEAVLSLADYRRLLAAASAAVERGEAQGARLLVARARMFQAAALQRLGQPDKATPAAQAARRSYAEAGDRSGEAVALNLIGAIVSESGDLEAARNIRREILEVQRQVGNRQEIAKALNNLADTLMSQGELAAARPLVEEALSEAREVRNARLEGGIRLNLAALQHRLGDLGAARKTAEEALATLEGYDFAYATHGAQLVLGEIHLAAGEVPAARTRLEEGLAATRGAGDLHFAARFLASLGQLELAAGNLQASRTLHEQALAAREQMGDRWLTAESRLFLALLALEAGEAAAGQDEMVKNLEEVAADFHQRGAIPGEIRATAALAAVRLAAGDEEIARREVERGAALLLRCEDWEAWSWSSLQLARSRAELGEKEAARTALEAVRDEAARRGFVPLELEARLTLVGLLPAAGGEGPSQELELVRRRAQERGLLRLAQKAAAVAPVP